VKREAEQLDPLPGGSEEGRGITLLYLGKIKGGATLYDK